MQRKIYLLTAAVFLVWAGIASGIANLIPIWGGIVEGDSQSVHLGIEGADRSVATESVADAAGTVDTGWVRLYNGLGVSSDVAVALAVDTEENVYVTGTSGTQPWEWATLKYDKSGTRSWLRRYSPPGSVYAAPVAIGTDRMGNAYVTGSHVTIHTDIVTAKYDSIGNVSWIRSDPPPIRLTLHKRGFILREEVVKDGNQASLHGGV